MGRPVAILGGTNHSNNAFALSSNQFSNISDQSRLVHLCGDVTEELINSVQQEILELAHISKSLPIHLIVSTYGGSVDEGFSLLDVMRFVPCPIYTVGLGKVMSMGSIILAAGEKGHRLIGKLTRVMIHSVSSGIQGNIFECMNEIDEIKKMQETLMRLLSENSKLTKNQINDLMSNKLDKYLTAEECVNYGICDKII